MVVSGIATKTKFPLLNCYVHISTFANNIVVAGVDVYVIPLVRIPFSDESDDSRPGFSVIISGRLTYHLYLFATSGTHPFKHIRSVLSHYRPIPAVDQEPIIIVTPQSDIVTTIYR